MAKPGMGKKSGKAMTYDGSQKGERQVRDLRNNVPALATKILKRDHTKMTLYADSTRQPVTVISPTLYNPVLKERNILAARLKSLIGKPTNAPIAVTSVDATAKRYPQLARVFNTEAFYRLSSRLRASTRPGENPETMTLDRPEKKPTAGKKGKASEDQTASSESFEDIGIKIEDNSEQGKAASNSLESLATEKPASKIKVEAEEHMPRPDVLTSGSVKRAREEISDKSFVAKRPRKEVPTSYEEQDSPTAKSVKEASVPVEAPVEPASVQMQESVEQECKQVNK